MRSGGKQGEKSQTDQAEITREEGAEKGKQGSRRRKTTEIAESKRQGERKAKEEAAEKKQKMKVTLRLRISFCAERRDATTSWDSGFTFLSPSPNAQPALTTPTPASASLSARRRFRLVKPAERHPARGS
eukprot:759517-Hanusia_phi.AAC.4